METKETKTTTQNQQSVKTDKPFFGAGQEQQFFSTERISQNTPFFQPSKLLSKNTIQAKLTVGAVGDRYEQEADRVAAQVVEQINTPATATGDGQSVQRMENEEENLQMKPQEPLQREAMDTKEELQMMPTMQQMTAEGGAVSADLEGEINRARGGGQSLAPDLQAQMGQAMGADFSGVRVHTNRRADQLNRRVGAQAFTIGQDLFFKQGEYQPENQPGQELIAHELAHVVQQHNVQIQQRKDKTSNVSELTSKSLGIPNLIQLKPEKAVLKREAEKNAGIHKSDHKRLLPGQKATVRRGGLFKTGIKDRIADDTVILVDYQKPDETGTYIWAKYTNTDEREKEGYINKDYVIPLNQLSTHVKANKLASDKKWRNKHQRHILDETATFLTSIGAYESGHFKKPNDQELTVNEYPDKEDFSQAPVTGPTAPENLSKQQRRFLAGISPTDGKQRMEKQELSRRGFIIRYQDYPNRFYNMILTGSTVLWTLDVNNMLSIGSPNNNKHAVVAGGKDVWAAGEARLKSATEHYQEKGEVTQKQIDLWKDIELKESEIQSYKTLGREKSGFKSEESFNSAIEKLEEEKNQLIKEIGGQQILDFIVKIHNEPAPVENPIVVIDFDSGHYSPSKAWNKAILAWEQTGFKVEWKTTSVRV